MSSSGLPLLLLIFSREDNNLLILLFPRDRGQRANDAAGTRHLQVGRPSLGSRSEDDVPGEFGSSASGHSATNKSIFIHGTRV
jgi:hypothetical protein